MALIFDDPNSSTRRRAPDSYLAYLNSSSWRATRNDALRRANYTCANCGSRRDLQVHHLTYERLGAEWASDLQVLCGSCHQGHHYAEAAADPSKVYVKLVSQVVAADPFAQIADIADDVKRLCVANHVPVNAALIDRAISLVCATRLKQGKPTSVTDAPEDTGRPLTHAESAEFLQRLRVALAGQGASESVAKPKTMPRARLVTRQRADQIRAFAMVTAEMEASIARCEALEAAIAEPQA